MSQECVSEVIIMHLFEALYRSGRPPFNLQSTSISTSILNCGHVILAPLHSSQGMMGIEDLGLGIVLTTVFTTVWSWVSHSMVPGTQ